MFEHFTFGAPAQTEHRSHIHDIAPCDTSFPSPRSPRSPRSPQSLACNQSAASSGMTYLVSKLEGQDIRPLVDDTPSSFVHGLPSPPADSDDEPLEVDEELLSKLDSITSSSYAESYSMPASIQCRRQQRQINTQLQCSKMYINSINALVEGMISSGSQCNVIPSPLYQPHIAPSSTVSSLETLESEPRVDATQDNEDVDEGFFEAEYNDQIEDRSERLLATFRRAHYPVGVRKYNSIRLRESEPARPRMQRRISLRKH